MHMSLIMQSENCVACILEVVTMVTIEIMSKIFSGNCKTTGSFNLSYYHPAHILQLQDDVYNSTCGHTLRSAVSFYSLCSLFTANE